MRIRKRIVTKDDFGDLNQYSSFSSFDILGIVAEKVSEREGFSVSQPQLPLPLDIIPMSEQPPIIVPHQATNSKSEPSKTPHLPPAFKEEISKLGGNDPYLVIQKELYKCDVNPDYSRISMPKNKSKIWLTDEEKRLLEVRDEKGRPVGFEVQVIDPGLKVRQVTFKKWSYTNTVSFVLVKHWNEIVVDNRLKIGELVQIWSFRMQGKLAFALVRLQSQSFDGKQGFSLVKHQDDQQSFDVHWGAKRRRT